MQEAARKSITNYRMFVLFVRFSKSLICTESETIEAEIISRYLKRFDLLYNVARRPYSPYWK